MFIELYCIKIPHSSLLCSFLITLHCDSDWPDFAAIRQKKFAARYFDLKRN